MEEKLLTNITTGVYVLSAHHQGQRNGTTVTWVTPVSYDPLLVMVSLAKVRFSHDLVMNSGFFGLNVLLSEDVDLARHFAFITAREKDKLEGMDFGTSENGLPILNKAHSYIECRVVDHFPAGEHTMFVGEVVSVENMNEGDHLLVFHQEDFF